MTVAFPTCVERSCVKTPVMALSISWAVRSTTRSSQFSAATAGMATARPTAVVSSASQMPPDSTAGFT